MVPAQWVFLFSFHCAHLQSQAVFCCQFLFASSVSHVSSPSPHFPQFFPVTSHLASDMLSSFLELFQLTFSAVTHGFCHLEVNEANLLYHWHNSSLKPSFCLCFLVLILSQAQGPSFPWFSDPGSYQRCLKLLGSIPSDCRWELSWMNAFPYKTRPCTQKSRTSYRGLGWNLSPYPTNSLRQFWGTVMEEHSIHHLKRYRFTIPMRVVP